MCRPVLAAALLAALTSPVLADDPHVTVQLQPMNAWTAQALGVLATLPPALVKDHVAELQKELNKGWRDAFDGSKPLGLYVTLAGKFENSEVVALAPVKDEKAFWKLLANYNVKPKEQNGTTTIELPFAPGAPWFVKFQHGHVYLARNAESLADTKLRRPEQVFDANEKSAVLVRGHIDRVPEDLRKEVLAGLEQFNNQLAMPGAPENLRKMYRDMTDFAALLLNDSRQATVKLVLSPAGELALDGQLAPKPGSALARYIGDMRPTTSRFAGLIGPDTTAVISQTYGLPAIIAGEAETVNALTEMLAGALANANIMVDRDKIDALTKAVVPSFLVEGYDNLYLLTGGKDGQYAAFFGQHIEHGLRAERALLAFVNELPKEVRQRFQLRTTKVEGFNLHRFNLGNVMPESGRAAFGSAEVAVAIRDDAVIVGVGADVATRVRQAVTLRPQAAPLVRAEVSLGRLWPLVERLTADDKDDAARVKKLRELVGADVGRVRLFQLSRDGGGSLAVRATTDLKAALKLILAVDATEKKP